MMFWWFCMGLKVVSQKSAFSSVLSKIAIKIERFNIFWIGFHQNSSNSCLYHICENEQDLRISIEQLYRKSAVAYVEWLILSMMAYTYFNFAQEMHSSENYANSIHLQMRKQMAIAYWWMRIILGADSTYVSYDIFFFWLILLFSLLFIKVYLNDK